ncbi:Arp complex subunit [Elasticomyces elasticus]|nr:Arp complex subunit [Elasticomyces elasticus]
MLLLDYQNVLIESILRDRFAPEASPTAIDQIISDFDNCTFHVSTPTSKSQILISLAIKCYPELIQYGAQSILEREYGQYIVDPESGYDFSLQIDLDNLPESTEAREELVEKVSLLKRNAMAAPYEQAFDEHSSLAAEAAKYTSESAPQGVREGGEVRAIHYREEEAIYIKASHDRVTVIFSTVFREETDRVYGKVFLQEFVDARKRGVQNAPQVLARDEPPLEIQGLPGVKAGRGDITYVTFGSLAPSVARIMCREGSLPTHHTNLGLVLFPRHLTPQRRQAVISHIQTFRDYFHYHIKASKAYIHSRMRRRTADFLQVLRRARPEEGGEGGVEKERKTASGRTFRVQA